MKDLSGNYYLGEKLALERLEDFNQIIIERSKTFMGYPCNGAFNLDRFFEWWKQSALSKNPLNEVGSPNTETLYSLNSHPFEVTVLQFFADLFHLKPHWGYITSGGTQGNEEGLYMGREFLAPFGSPILYFSEEAHYSIGSLGKELGLERCSIHSQASGEMDYEDLKKKLITDRPALFSLSIGTTFKGAIDRIEIIKDIVLDREIKHVFYHADAALFGGFLPFYPDPAKPHLNFEIYPYDSIAVSGHKFFGSPVPLGIFLIRDEYIRSLEAEYIEYLHTSNLTIPCSRSSLNTLIFWWLISTNTKNDFVQQSKNILENANYLYKQLEMRKYPSWLNPFSNTVFFRAPSKELCKKWVLSLFTCRRLGPLAHVVVMQHVTKRMINEFLQELDLERHLLPHQPESKDFSQPLL